jgi:hypothetical protein
MKKKFTAKSVCEDCGGTGIYVGFAEQDGAGVVCHNCDGTGCDTISIKYEDFVKRVKKKGIERVFEANPGIGIGKGKNKAEYKLEDFGGMPFEDWFRGKRFPRGSEMRKYSCPCWWYQCTDYEKKPDWDECAIGGTFSSCENFKNKHLCWERFDKGQGEGK